MRHPSATAAEPVALAGRRTGERGPPVVILHGLFGSSRNWATIAHRLGRRARVHAVDLRNHGASPWSAAMGYDELVADLAAYLDAQGLDRPVLIGHSLGGKTAMLAALADPARPAGLIVVDIAPAPYRESLLDHVEAVADVVLEGAQRRAEVDEDLAGLIPDPGVRSFILQNLVQERGRFRWRVNLAALKAHANDLSDFRPAPNAAYPGPTLFLAGGRSGYLADRHRSRIAGLFPAAEIATVAAAGHYLQAEQPDAFLDLVTAFLDRL